MHTCVGVHVCVCACMHVCVYVCMHAYIIIMLCVYTNRMYASTAYTNDSLLASHCTATPVTHVCLLPKLSSTMLNRTECLITKKHDLMPLNLGMTSAVLSDIIHR